MSEPGDIGFNKAEDVLEAIRELFEGALPAALVQRNQEKPDSVPVGGLVIIWDGEPGEPDQYFCPSTFVYTHRIPVEFATYTDAISKENALKDMKLALGAAMARDRQLGGRVDWLQAAPAGVTAENLDAKGTETGRWATFDVLATYGTSDPLS